MWQFFFLLRLHSFCGRALPRRLLEAFQVQAPQRPGVVQDRCQLASLQGRRRLLGAREQVAIVESRRDIAGSGRVRRFRAQHEAAQLIGCRVVQDLGRQVPAGEPSREGASAGRGIPQDGRRTAILGRHQQQRCARRDPSGQHRDRHREAQPQEDRREPKVHHRRPDQRGGSDAPGEKGLAAKSLPGFAPTQARGLPLLRRPLHALAEQQPDDEDRVAQHHCRRDQDRQDHLGEDIGRNAVRRLVTLGQREGRSDQLRRQDEGHRHAQESERH